MVSKAFSISSFINNLQADGTFAAGVLSGVITYSIIDDLPLAGNSIGDLAFVDSTNFFYVYTSNGWFSINLDSSI